MPPKGELATRLTCEVAAGKNVLNDMLQRVRLGFLEIVAPVDGIEPGVEEVLGPLPIPYDDAGRHQALLVLCDDEVYSVALEISESLDDTVRGHYGLVGDHDVLEAGGLEYVRLEVDVRVHD